MTRVSKKMNLHREDAKTRRKSLKTFLWAFVPSWFVIFALSFLTSVSSFAAPTDSHAFDVVATGDATYSQLQQLENEGLLPAGASQGPLTRFEVAQRVFHAKKKLKEIILAQADMELPPPPPDSGNNSNLPPPAPGEAGGATSQEAAPAAAVTLWNNPDKIAEAEKNLNSLQDAYDLELKLVTDQKSDLESQVSQTESDQFDLWKSVKGITEYPSISIHGLGRMYAFSEQYYGITSEAARNMFGFLDLEPTGSVSKEIRWDGIIRMGTTNLPLAGTATPYLSVGSFSGPYDYLSLRRIEADFNPDFMSAKVGDFYEAYTPFTIWNRNNRDLYYMPEMVARGDEDLKYESFLDHEPAWPFRGLELGTALGWPDSDLLQSVQVSAFAHMINNSLNDQTKWYFGPNDFSGWIFAGQGEVKSKKWYTDDISWQLDLQDYEVVLDQPVDSEEPGSPYNPYVASTWAHQYVISSFRPSLVIGFGDDIYAGLQYEGAFSSYQDNKVNPGSIISDYALNIEPYLQMGDSKISFHYLNVGPNFYSPLAQTRQDVNSFSPVLADYFPGESLSPGSIQNQFFLSNVPRPSGIFGYYDRTQDNTFPYGLSTPNREGAGLELDIETLNQKSLKIKGAAYLVQEISDNIVANSAGTGYTILDPASNGQAPMRQFTYVNFGPSFDLGPNIGLTTPLEFGTNLRYEQTTSAVGTLDAMGFWLGVRIGLLKEWEVAGAVGLHSASGSEEGLYGSVLARSSYQFDNTDLGHYAVFTVNDTDQNLLLSTTFRFDRNSSVYVDYDLVSGDQLPGLGQAIGTLYNQFIGMTYEIEF